MNSNFIGRLWRESFTNKIFSKIGKAFIKSLNNSIIISNLLNGNKIYGRDGILIKIIENIKINIIKISKKIKNIFFNTINNSFAINIVRNLKKDIGLDIYRFLLIVFGTSLVSYGILSFTKGIHSWKRILFFVVLGILPLIIGFLDIEINMIFKESKFANLIKKVFDYNS